MEDRYEIRGKIGQGGLGAVYRAHDIRMSREVAIKRILTNSDNSISDEATRQLIKEAGALASLQHPNIVTIYDVGSDEDGPFVVMELLSGDTLEEIIGKGSFTWLDFRQLAMQTLEALIAAQELHLVHRDLKPGNIMLTWLPSGKFQVKIVDFGLAKLSSAPSLQTIDQSDGVFGSIYFMAPEQFERVPLDQRADLYAIGCVFYYALTGSYPFDGDTAAEVMASHLQHHTEPIQEVRSGIPLWACDWIMWHINRQPSDRPQSAREALQYFIENDEQSSPALSTGTPAPPVEQPKRPRLLIPGSAPVPEVVEEAVKTQSTKTASAPKPLLPPEGSKPSVHTTSQVFVSSAPEPPHEHPAPGEPDEPAPAAAAALPILSRAVTNPTPTPTAPALATASPATKRLASPTGKITAQPTKSAKFTPPPAHKSGISNGTKMAIASVIGILAVLLAVMLLKRSGENAESKLYNEMISKASRNEPVPVDSRKLEILLRNSASVALNQDRYNIYLALYLAEATDNTDIDARIADFATTGTILPEVRIVLIRDVLRKRKNPAVVKPLLEFVRKTDDPKAAVAALEAIRFMATEAQFPAFIQIIASTDKDILRKAAEKNAAEVIGKSTEKEPLFEQIRFAYEAAPNQIARHSMLRLLGRIGGSEALDLTKSNLKSEDPRDRIAALGALASWGDRSGFQALLDFLSSGPEQSEHNRAFSSAAQYASESTSDQEENWSALAGHANTAEDQVAIVRGLVGIDPAPWSFAILEKYKTTSEFDRVQDLSQKGISRLKETQKNQANATAPR